MGATPPKLVANLVERFERDRKVFQSPDYKEEQLRIEFLNPLFTALGWDMDDAIDTIRTGNWGSALFPRASQVPISGLGSRRVVDNLPPESRMSLFRFVTRVTQEDAGRRPGA